jgi:hypothetical protein
MPYMVPLSWSLADGKTGWSGRSGGMPPGRCDAHPRPGPGERNQGDAAALSAYHDQRPPFQAVQSDTIEDERTAATLARWIFDERPTEIHVRHLQRTVRLPGLRTAGLIKKAANELVPNHMLGTRFGGRLATEAV